MKKRLEELNWRTLPQSLNEGDDAELVEVFDSEASEVVARSSISLKARQKKIA